MEGIDKGGNMKEILSTLTGEQLSLLIRDILAILPILFGTTVAALVQGKVIRTAVESISKQPEAAGDIRSTMIVGLAMVESMAIYCLLIALLFIFIGK